MKIRIYGVLEDGSFSKVGNVMNFLAFKKDGILVGFIKSPNSIFHSEETYIIPHSNIERICRIEVLETI